MYSYRPASWSAQARRMADYQFYNYLFFKNNPDKVILVPCHSGKLDDNFERVCFRNDDIRYYEDFFSYSYRDKLIRERAAKRFRRLCKKYHLGRT